MPGFILARLNDQVWWQAWNKKLSEILSQSILSAMKVGTKTASRQLQMDIRWDYIQPAALEWAQQQAGKLVSGIFPDIQMGIAQIVTAGLSGGKTVYQIRDEIAALRDSREQNVFPEWRAMRIARTEVIRAHAQGAKLGYQESGVVRGMRWLDGQTGACPKCKELHNKVVRLGEKFYIDPKFGDGLPPRHPHCRCAVAPVTLDQVKYLPVDHPLRDNRRSSIEEITDIQAYAEIGGVRVTGERLRHAQYKHPEIRGMIDIIQRGLLSPDAITDKGEVRVYHVGINRMSSRGNPLYLNIAVKMGESPFMLTSYIAPIKK